MVQVTTEMQFYRIESMDEQICVAKTAQRCWNYVQVICSSKTFQHGNKRMRVGIVGAGPAGIISCIAISSAMQSNRDCLLVDVYESRQAFRGRSFDTSSDSMLLNTSIGVSPVEWARPNGFLEYLRREEQRDVDLGEVVPRDAARRYLEYELQLARERTPNISIISAKVDDVCPAPDDQVHIYSSGVIKAYDAVVLASGLNFKQPPVAFAGVNTITPYPADRLAQIDSNAAVLVLGSRLSAVDALVYLATSGHTGRVDVHSRSGLFPSVRKSVVKPEQRPLLNSYLSLSQEIAPTVKLELIVAYLEQHLDRCGMRLGDFIPMPGTTGRSQLDHEIRLCEEGLNLWEPLLMDVIDTLNHLWPQLNSEAKRDFHRDVNGWLGRIAHSMPLRNALVVQRMFDSGQLRFVGIEEIRDLRDYGQIINATGLSCADNDPLLRRMAMRGLLRFNGAGGVEVEPSRRTTTRDGMIYANGSIIQNEIFTANSLYSTAHGAECIARDMLQKLAFPIQMPREIFECAE
ncbi:hypothetical protein HJB96_33175 [Rhizobium sp. NLR15a]|nr:hypothetical protein [Rhizobium sp. NLR15a]